jgi:proteasome lid subunit RPN8/RPN11
MKLNKSTIEEISRHALETYPEECCGIVTGDSDRQTVHLCRNIQDRLHSEDPGKYPRDARTAYAIERNEAEKIFAEAKEQGKSVIAFYHSHVEHDAYFSDMDKEAQSVFGEPEFPEALQVVISVKDRKINGIKHFKWDKDKKDFMLQK